MGGSEGWWNATPASGNTAGLPQETVAINTRTNTVVDAMIENFRVDLNGNPLR
ncbi:hypothetical protein BJQ90_04308 [Arthrobacter sp. SO3]|nr:hypothetical protein [Arthrobacter sp. SO3]